MLLLGAHTSASGGLEQAIYEGQRIGATTVQLFTANQRQWRARSITEEMCERFRQALKETGLSHIMSHGSYLVNLGSPRVDILEKSRAALQAEIERCLLLDLSYLNIHPGSALDSSVEQCLDTIVQSLREVEPFLQNKKLKILLEMTAGQGSCVGKTLEEIGYLVERVSSVVSIGVCVDTCHVFSAGYDISTQDGLHQFLEEFHQRIGLQFLRALHINDSKRECGSHVDRHASLGAGCMGLDAFSHIMKEPRLRGLPMYLETPEGPEVWKKEIAWLRSQA